MLEHLFGSNTRIKLLQLFLNNAEKEYFVRELTRLLNAQINAIRRELQNLEDMGLIEVIEIDKDGDPQNRKFYRTNPKFLLLPELKNIIQKSQFIMERKFADSLQKIGDVHFLALTGSFVGEANIPTDILIVGHIEQGKLKLKLKNFEENFKREINYTLMEPEEFNYRRNVADRFLYSILDSKKIVIIDRIMNTNVLE